MKCSGTRRDGKPCTADAVQGGTHCKTHGGLKEGRRSLAERRRELHEWQRDLETREKALARRKEGHSPYREAAEHAVGPGGDVDDPMHIARALTWRALAVVNAIEKAGREGSKEHAGWIEVARRNDETWHRIKLDERYVRITTAQAMGLMRAVDQGMTEIGLPEETQAALREAVAGIMDRAKRQLLEVG